MTGQLSEPCPNLSGDTLSDIRTDNRGSLDPRCPVSGVGPDNPSQQNNSATEATTVNEGNDGQRGTGLLPPVPYEQEVERLRRRIAEIEAEALRPRGDVLGCTRVQVSTVPGSSRVAGRGRLLRSLRALIQRCERYAQHRARTPQEKRWAGRVADQLERALRVGLEDPGARRGLATVDARAAVGRKDSE